MSTREYSKRLGVINDGQLQAALDRFGLGKLVAAEPVKSGLFGQNMLLDRLIIWEFVQRAEPEVAARIGSLREWAERYTTALPAWSPEGQAG